MNAHGLCSGRATIRCFHRRAVPCGSLRFPAAVFADGSPIRAGASGPRAVRSGRGASQASMLTIARGAGVRDKQGSPRAGTHAGRKQDTGMRDTRSPRAAQPRAARRLTLAAAAARVRVEVTITWTRAGGPAGAAPLLARLAAAVRSLDDGRGPR